MLTEDLKNAVRLMNNDDLETLRNATSRERERRMEAEMKAGATQAMPSDNRILGGRNGDLAAGMRANMNSSESYPAKDTHHGIGWAIQQMQGSDQRVTRAGWNGKGIWLALQWPDRNSKMTLPYIYMKTADDQLVPWLASQSDLLAGDWKVAL